MTNDYKLEIWYSGKVVDYYYNENIYGILEYYNNIWKPKCNQYHYSFLVYYMGSEMPFSRLCQVGFYE